MNAFLNFLKPTWLKLLFLVELPAFLIIELLSKGITALENGYIFLLPLGLYYLIACSAIYLHKSGKLLDHMWKGFALAVFFFLLDQGVKAAIWNIIPEGGYRPIVPGFLNLAHAQNTYGSWLFAKLEWDFIGAGFLIALIFVFSFFTIAAYRYYTHTVRRSLLADLSFVFYLAAFMSAFIDIAVRGFTIDFIQLPGYVTADLKDIYLWFGTACLLAETFDNPNNQWNMSFRDFGQAFVRMLRYQVRR